MQGSFVKEIGLKSAKTGQIQRKDAKSPRNPLFLNPNNEMA